MTVRLWDPRTGQEISTLEGHTDEVDEVYFSPNGRMLVSRSLDHDAMLWSPATGRLIEKMEWPVQYRSLTFSSDSKLLASGGLDDCVRLWNLVTDQVQILERCTRHAFGLAFNRDNSLLASICEDAAVRIWDPHTGQQLQLLSGHSGTGAWTIRFSPDGSTLVSTAGDCTIRVWDLSTEQEMQNSNEPTQKVLDIVFSTNGSLLASASDDSIVRIWDVTTGREMFSLTGHTSSVLTVAFSPNGTMLASGSEDKNVRLWDVVAGRATRTLEGHTHPVTVVTFSPKGSLLASRSRWSTVRLWDVATGCVIHELEDCAGDHCALAFSPNSLLLVSAMYSMIKLFDVNTGLESCILEAEDEYDWIKAISFSSDSLLLAVAHQSGFAYVWSIEDHQIVTETSIGWDDDMNVVQFTLDNIVLLARQRLAEFPNSQAPYTLSRSEIHHCISNYNGLLVQDEWVLHRGRRILWLPPEYRRWRSIVQGNKLATKLPWGSISFLQINPEQLQ